MFNTIKGLGMMFDTKVSFGKHEKNFIKHRTFTSELYSICEVHCQPTLPIPSPAPC